MSINNTITYYGKKLANVKLFFFSVFWLMVLLTVGTIAQKDIGLYQAQQFYFSSWFIWIFDYIPIPGGQLTMGAVFVGLTAQIVFKSPLKQRTLGITITHIGALLLLLGGIITGMFSVEGSMVIDEGGASSQFQDFHKIEVAIIDPAPKDHDTVTAFGPGWLKKGEVLKSTDIPFQIEVQSFCENCTYEKRKDDEVSPEGHHGFSSIFKLKSIPMDKEDGKNRAGVVFKVSGSDNDGIYAIFENMQIPQSISFKDKKYYIQIRHLTYNLPFKIELLDFVKTDYASTSMAKSYKSVVNFIDGKIKQRTIIQMNEPLRYKGYTLYQSSYIQDGGKETTVLSVVHNLGRMFPYISSIIICIGIVIHLLIISGLFKKPQSEAL